MNKFIVSAFRNQSIIEDASVCLRSGKSYRGKVFVVDMFGRKLDYDAESSLDNKAIQVITKPIDRDNNPIFVLVDPDAIESISIHLFSPPIHSPDDL